MLPIFYKFRKSNIVHKENQWEAQTLSVFIY